MEDSIFTKIIKGQIPCHKIYEDEHTMAFLDISPNERGHTLLVPKKQVDKIYELDDETYGHMWQIAKKIAIHYEATLGHRVTFQVVGIDVPHAHIHIIPYNPVNHPDHAKHAEEKQVGTPDHESLARTAEMLRLV